MYKWQTRSQTRMTRALSSSGRSGALSVSLASVLRVRQKALNEVECWAVLFGTVQALQDKLLQLNGLLSTSLDLCARFDEMLLSSSRLRLTAQGQIEVDNCEVDDQLDLTPPNMKPLFDLTEADLEKIGLFSVGKTLFNCLTYNNERAQDFVSAELLSLLAAMIQPELHNIPTLLQVLERVESHWKSAVGGSPVCQFISQLCQFTLGGRPIAVSRKVSRTSLYNQEKNDAENIEFSRLNCSSSSDSGDDILGNCLVSPTILPKPPGNIPQIGLASPFGTSLPSLLQQCENNNELTKPPTMESRECVPCSSKSSHDTCRHRRYGKRLEFKPPMTQNMQRRFVPGPQAGGVRTNLSKDKSFSASGLPEVKPTDGESGNNQRRMTRSRMNGSRLYRVVRPLVDVPGRGTKCIGPEFVVMSGQPVVQVDLTDGRTSSVRRAMVVLLTGQRIEVTFDPITTTANDVLKVGLRHLDMKVKEMDRFSLAQHSNGEWLYISPEQKMSKLSPVGSKALAKGGICSITVYQRFHFYPKSLEELSDPSSQHLFYLQLRKDTIEGHYRIDVGQQMSLAALAIQVEFGDYAKDTHSSGPYFLTQHYLPEHVRTLLGEKEARSMLEKLHKSKETDQLKDPKLSFCHQIMTQEDYGFHMYTGRENKKNDCPSTTFAIHVQGIFFFEISRNVFKPPKVIQSYPWRSIKKIQYSGSKLQLSVLDKTGVSKVRLYMPETRSKHVFDITSAHHKYYLTSLSNAQDEDLAVEKETKSQPLKTFCNRIINYAKDSSQKQFSSAKDRRRSNPMGRYGLKRTTSVSQSNVSPTIDKKYTVRRLTHYSSMANGPAKEQAEELSTDIQQTYRYKVYLENEDDDEDPQPMEAEPLSDHSDKENTTPKNPLPSKPVRRKSMPSTITTFPRSVSRKNSVDQGRRRVSSVRMGTRVSTHAIQRERLRTIQPSKSTPDDLLPQSISTTSTPISQTAHPMWVMSSSQATNLNSPDILPGIDDSLSASLLERFDQMDAEEGEPERKIVQVELSKDPRGRLGIKITGTPSGIYVESIDESVAQIQGELLCGDRLVAVNGRSLENVNYCSALDLIRASKNPVSLLVSQIR